MVSATTTLSGSRILVPITPGSTMNRASEGIVYSNPAVVISGGYSHR